MTHQLNQLNKKNDINMMILNRKLHEKEERINELNQQVTKLLILNHDLMNTNRELQNELTDIKQNKQKELESKELKHDILLRTAEEFMDNNNVLSENSMKKIDEIIDSFLMNENINLQLVPDTIERKIYRNVFIVAFGLLDELISNSSIKFLGHEIVMKMQSQSQSQSQSQ